MLRSTSRIRLTSSIRATPRRVVLPSLSRQAHSSATAAFLLDFTSIGTGQLLTADDPQVRRPDVAELHQAGVEGGADPGQDLQRDVLLALLDPGDRALAGAEGLGQLGLRPAPVLAGIPDQGADLHQVLVAHGHEDISHVR